MSNTKHVKTFESFLDETKSVNEGATAKSIKEDYSQLLKPDGADSPNLKQSKRALLNTLKNLQGIYKMPSQDIEALVIIINEYADAYSDNRINNEALSEGAITKAIKPPFEGEVKAAVEALERELQSTGAILDYKHADRLADCIVDIVDAAKQEARDEYND